jgi:3-deoxy-D-manno-octulosonic-acid transferase
VVSVGEANLIGKLLSKLKDMVDCPIIISTTTLTGNRVAKQKYSSLAKVFFFPLDISFVLARVIKIFKPKIFIAAETEIWPNLFCRLKRKHVPIVIINGRISDRAFRRYMLIKPTIRKVLGKCNYVGVQNEYYKNRFVSLGCKEEKIIISGNMKFESISINEKHLARLEEECKPFLKINNSLLIVAGSTHYPEEGLILNAYRDLVAFKENLSLLIAPRHIERVPLIEKSIMAVGFKPIKVSKLKEHSPNGKPVFILDTIGELLYFYALSDICFVGGSLVRYGGHNILEPIYFSKPTIFGSSMDNFKDIEEIILEKGAGIQVKDGQELREVLLRLVKDEILRNNLQQKCLNVFDDERKSLEKNLEIILKCLR